MAATSPLPGSSRPASRAQSDVSFATAYTQKPASGLDSRPESSHSARTVSRDIDYIKSLIDRSQVSPRSPGSISAQIFRRRSRSDVTVSQTHIFHELESLKRRLKTEMPSMVRRPSEIGPDDESDEEAVEMPDEREQEIERLREDIINTREHAEQLITAAEDRVDDLLGQKEALEGMLGELRRDLRAVNTDNQRLERCLQDTQDDSMKLRVELGTARMTLERHRNQIDALQSRSSGTTAAQQQADEHIAKLEALRLEMEASLATSRERTRELEAENKTAAERLQMLMGEHADKDKSSRNEMDKLQKRHKSAVGLAEEYRASSEIHQARVNQAEGAVSRVRDEYETRCQHLTGQLEEHRRLLQTTLAEMDAHKEEHSTLQKGYDSVKQRAEKLGKQVDEHQAYLDTIRQEKEAAEHAVATKTAEHEKHVRQLKEVHKVERDEYENGFAECAKAFADLKASHVADVDSEETRHFNEIQALKARHADETLDLSSKLRAAQAQLDSDVSKDADRINELQVKHSNRLRALEEQYRDDVRQIRAASEQQAQQAQQEAEEARLAAEEKWQESTAAHQEELNDLREALHGELTELQTESQSAADLHRTEMTRLERSLQDKLAELTLRYGQEKAVEMSAKQELFSIEITALQARLDAALTGQAEAERSLAVYRQQKAEGDKRAVEAYDALKQSFAEAESEKQSLAKKYEQTERSLRGLKRASMVGLPSATNAEELAALKLRVTTLEQEKDEAQTLLSKTEQERFELARQNEFLAKQVGESLSTQPTPDLGQQSNAFESFESLESEPKADAASMRLIKADRLERPATPMSPDKRRAKAEIKRAWKGDSFEDYLQRAQAELSELGSAISANEALFTQKISEHVGDLQRAKNALSAEYKAKLGKLAAERDRMERVVAAKQAAEFASERRQLVASYGGNVDAINTAQSDLPVQRAKALHSAEERLVKEYNKRVARRTSEIALRHAEEFQSLTRDFDRKMQDLLSSRQRLEGDLSIDPARFEKDMGQIDALSERLETEKAQSVEASPTTASTKQERGTRPSRMTDASKSSTPQKLVPGPELTRPEPVTRTSFPRTPSSIPRAVPFPGNRNSPDATSQPLVSRRPYGERSTPPLPQGQRRLRAGQPSAVPTDKSPGADPTGEGEGGAESRNDSVATSNGASPSAAAAAGAPLPAPSVFEQHAAKERASLEAIRQDLLRRSKEHLPLTVRETSRSRSKLSSAMIYCNSGR